MELPILVITYERITNEEEVTLTTSNCADYGFTYVNNYLDDTYGTNLLGRVFYKIGTTPEEHIEYVINEDTNEFETTYLFVESTTYTHNAPPCSSYMINYADVDTNASGRNTTTGSMERERLGSYRSIDVTFDLIPNSKTYNNWYKILTHLPPKFSLSSLQPSGVMETYDCYRADISTNLYLFIDNNNQIWQGLKTSFIQNDLSEYDDKIEPELED